MSQTLGLRSHLCARVIAYMAIVLMEWSQYCTDKTRDGEDIPLWSLVKSAWPRLVYFNLLTVFFALYFKLSWADFRDLRRHRDRLYYLVQFASALEHGIKDLVSFQKWQQCRSQAPQMVTTAYPAIIAGKEEGLGLKRCFKFALYVSALGEKVFQAIVKESEESARIEDLLKKVETFTAEGSVLRIWYGSDCEPPLLSVFHKFWDRASEDGYKAISSFPEGDVTEVGYYSGPLRFRSVTDFDYDLSKADGTSWICLSCREVFNDFEHHGFLREWKAMEELGNNGHSLGIHPTEHINGEVFCKECGCYKVIDEKTGLEVNNSY